QAATEEHFTRREMNVKARRMHVFAERVPEVAGGMFLVRTFVFREAHVAIDAKHRAAVRPRIGGETPGDFGKPWRHRGDEFAHRRLHALAEARLVGLKPR